MPQLHRVYDLLLETLTPVHVSLGPEELLIPNEECDTDGATTWVVDRPALIGALVDRPGMAAPAAPHARPTYRQLITDERLPVAQRQLLLAQMRMFGANPDDPAPDDDAPDLTPPPARVAPPAWEIRPRDLLAAEKSWRGGTGEDLLRYILDGTPRVPGAPDGEWWEAISRLPRTIEGNIALPASGLKGALRTVLAWAMLQQIRPEQLVAPNPGNPRYAAQPMERQTLAPESLRVAPNYDAGRLLRTSDATMIGQAAIVPFGILTAKQWRVFQGGAPQGAAAVEAIPSGAHLHARLTIDTFLLERWVDRRTEGNSVRSVPVYAAFRPVFAPDLGPLLAAGRDFARAVLQKDQAFYADVAVQGTAIDRPRGAIERLITALGRLEPNQTMFQIGWGTGRAGKTPYRLLLADYLATAPPQTLDRAKQDLVGRVGGARSRRLAETAEGAPDQPFGWVRCTVSPRAVVGE